LELGCSFGCGDGLVQQERNGRGSHSTGDWCDQAGSVGGGGVFDDVAGAVAGVDDDGSGFDPGTFDEFGLSNCGYDDVGLADDRGQVGGP
jgi:hypothetical protein